MKRKTRLLCNKLLKIYLCEQEYNKFCDEFKQGICKSHSEYGRKKLLRRPITLQYRNKSADEAVEANIELIAALKQFLAHPSLTETEKEWLRTEIGKIQEVSLKIFSLCSPK